MLSGVRASSSTRLAAARRTRGIVSGTLRTLARVRVGSMAVLLAAVAAPRIALSDVAAMSWTAPVECPDEPTVSAELQQRVGADLDAAMHVSARIERTASGLFRLTLDLEGREPHAERVLEDFSCRALATAAVIIVALAMERPEPVANESRATAIAAPTEQPPRVERQVAKRPVAHASRRVGLGIDLRLAADAGTLPGLAAGIGAATRLLVGAYRVEAGGFYWPARRSGGDVGAQVDLLDASLRLCRVVPVFTAMEASACLGLDGGALRAVAFGVDEPLAPTVFWLAAAGGGAVRMAAGPVSLAFGLEALVPAARPRFYFHEQGLVYRPAAVAGRLSVAAGWSFR